MNRPTLAVLAEWDWVYTRSPGGHRLHHVAEWEDPDIVEPYGQGVTTCGYCGELAIPGIVSRLGLPRCAHCCDRLSIPRGKGSPKNDEELRPWVKERLAAVTDGT